MFGINILYLINYAGKAGTEKYVSNLMRILSAQGENCHLAYNVPGQLSEMISAEGYPCFQLEMSTRKALSAAKKLARYCRANEISVIHAQYPMENVIAILSKLFYKKVKVIFTSHLIVEPNAKWKILNRIFTPFNHRVIAVSQQAGQAMVVNGVKKSRIVLIPNGIEPEGSRIYDRSFARSFGVPDETFVMSISTRFTPEKGMPFLLAALSKLKRKTDKPFVCFIAGDGPEFDEFARMSTNSRMSDCVIQLGYRTDVKQMLRSSDLYLNCSSSEAMSFAILEAMVSGVPVVATNVGGNPCLVSDGIVCGSVADYGDTDGYSDAMLELMNAPDTLDRYSDNAIKKVKECFDLKILIGKTFETYK